MLASLLGTTLDAILAKTRAELNNDLEHFTCTACNVLVVLPNCLVHEVRSKGGK